MSAALCAVLIVAGAFSPALIGATATATANAVAVAVAGSAWVDVAWAAEDESLGSVDRPAVGAGASSGSPVSSGAGASAGTGASAGAGARADSSASVEVSSGSGVPASAATEETVEDVGANSPMSVSSEGDAAVAEGLSWGLVEFSRSQAGSNRAVDGVYSGYNYYVGKEPGSLAVVSTGDYAVVYLPAGVADAFGLDASSQADAEALKAYLVALDEVNARGSSRLATVGTWYFTSSQSYDVGFVRFLFDEELSEGRFYTCVIGADGGDVTAQSHAGYVTLEHADFARLAAADEVGIAKEATGVAWLVEFLQDIDYRPLFVTLKTTGTAIVFIFALGLLAAYFTMRISPRAQDIFDSVFTIPMVLPPTVCGFLLLLAFGRNTAVGSWFYDIGFPLFFSWPATVIAAVVVAFPLMYRSARGAFEGLDPNMLDAARTLGWGEWKIFFRLMLPLSWSSIAAGTVLAFARALGEFGATLFLAGNYAGVTTTIPIAIYFEWMNGNTDVAIFWTIIIMIFSFVVILFINLWSRRTTKFRRKDASGEDCEAFEGSVAAIGGAGAIAIAGVGGTAGAGAAHSVEADVPATGLAAAGAVDHSSRAGAARANGAAYALDETEGGVRA